MIEIALCHALLTVLSNHGFVGRIYSVVRVPAEQQAGGSSHFPWRATPSTAHAQHPSPLKCWGRFTAAAEFAFTCQQGQGLKAECFHAVQVCKQTQVAKVTRKKVGMQKWEAKMDDYPRREYFLVQKQIKVL